MALELQDFDPHTGALQVRHGKGGKIRRVYLPEGALAAVKAWLQVRGEQPGALICPVRRGGHIEIRAMTDQAVMTMLQRRAKKALIDTFSPHDFRRTFITNLLEAKVDVLTISRLAGHSDPATTQKYDLRGEEAKRQAVQLLHIPYEP